MDHSHTLSLVLILTLILVLIQTLIADWPAAAVLLSGPSKDQIL